MSILRRIQNGETSSLGPPTNGNNDGQNPQPTPIVQRKMAPSGSQGNQDTYQDLKIQGSIKAFGCA